MCMVVSGSVCMCMVVCICVWPCVYVYAVCICVWPCVYVYAVVFDWYPIRMSVRSGVLWSINHVTIDSAQYFGTMSL